MDNLLNEDGRQYMQMLQSNIERMAANSANCKTWMVGIESAFLAINCSIQNLHSWVALGVLPIVLFWYLDTMYLQLERGLRNRERYYLNMVRNQYANLNNIVFDFSPLLQKENDINNGYVTTVGMWKSKSILWFYLLPSVIIIGIAIVMYYK